ncbi:alpha/beta hydrolase fold family protein [Mycobacterium ulcerans str. Harvey]|uniref:Alpha/beta hydrolase fold family protein n=1 Tax=Mycobacterium ulcerans str. Harvey TaxID=1299332 RepID=A0ABN0QSR8_MYCUL|nr:alpha/beta hydrolase fold family protein [Mycobacterium ulcerans str. Harvey]
MPVIDVPVQLIVNTKDPYVRPYGYDETARWVPRLWRRDIKAGHFSPMSHPQVMAAAVHDFADLVDGKPPSRALLRAQVGRPASTSVTPWWRSPGRAAELAGKPPSRSRARAPKLCSATSTRPP